MFFRNRYGRNCVGRWLLLVVWSLVSRWIYINIVLYILFLFVFFFDFTFVVFDCVVLLMEKSGARHKYCPKSRAAGDDLVGGTAVSGVAVAGAAAAVARYQHVATAVAAVGVRAAGGSAAFYLDVSRI